MKQRERFSSLRLAAIVALIATFCSPIGCTASGPETQSGNGQVQQPQTTQPTPKPQTATATDTPQDDPAAATKTVDVKIGEPLLEVKTSGGYTVGGILGKNGLTQADLGAVLEDKANAGMIGARCSVSVPNQTVADAIADRLDGGVDAGGLRGSSVFYNAPCNGPPDYRVLKNGTLRLPDHGRADLGKQLVGANSNIADLGKRVGSLVDTFDHMSNQLNATNGKLNEMDTAARARAQADQDRWNKVLAGILLAAAGVLIAGLVIMAYRKKHPKVKNPGTVMDEEAVAQIIKQTREADAKQTSPLATEAMADRLATLIAVKMPQPASPPPQPPPIDKDALVAAVVAALSPKLEETKAALETKLAEAVPKLDEARTAFEGATSKLEAATTAMSTATLEGEKARNRFDAAVTYFNAEAEGMQNEREGSSGNTRAAATAGNRRVSTRPRASTPPPAGTQQEFQRPSTPTRRPGSADGAAVSIPVITRQGLGGLSQLLAAEAAHAHDESREGGDANEPHPPTMTAADLTTTASDEGARGGEEGGDEEADLPILRGGVDEEPTRETTLNQDAKAAELAVQSAAPPANDPRATAAPPPGTDDADEDADVEGRTAVYDGLNLDDDARTIVTGGANRVAQPITGTQRVVRHEEIEVSFMAGEGLSFVCRACKKVLADDHEQEAHEDVPHVQCMECGDKPCFAGLNAWNHHCETAHSASSNGVPKSLPPPASHRAIVA
jgi:hypothetical protein